MEDKKVLKNKELENVTGGVTYHEEIAGYLKGECGDYSEIDGLGNHEFEFGESVKSSAPQPVDCSGLIS